MHQFSEELIDDCIRYFKESFAEELTRETANEYLNSYADLYESMMAFADPKYDKK